MKEKEKEWKETINRYVGYIDIMGFKDLVIRSTHNEIYKMMKKIELNRKKNVEINWGYSGDNSEEAIPELVKTTNYSDSIIIYSKDDSYDSLYSFLCVVAGLSSDLFMEGIPHKGAFAFGTMTLDITNSIFFGQPLIDAYLLEGELNFYGVVGHATAEKEINTHQENKQLVFLKDYLCPFKNGSSIHLTIYPLYSHPSSNNQPADATFRKHQKALLDAIKKLRYGTSGYLRKYVDNTEQYLKFVRENKEDI